MAKKKKKLKIDFRDLKIFYASFWIFSNCNSIMYVWNLKFIQNILTITRNRANIRPVMKKFT